MTTPASLDRFHPLVGDWFAGTFDAPTPPMGGELEDRTSVVYVSPLKALSNDIQKNLWEPLRAIRQLAEERGTPLSEIRVAVRTGDTPPKERECMRRRPPHILAQQIVATVASHERTEHEMLALARCAYPYRDLSRGEYEAILTAITCGGAIPDVADYQVIETLAILGTVPTQKTLESVFAMVRSGTLDEDLVQAAIDEVKSQAWPDVRDADELHDALSSLVLLPAQELGNWREWMGELVHTGRATRITWSREPEEESHLQTRGASFLIEIARTTGHLESQIEEVLWELVAHGLVTGDGIAGLRLLLAKGEVGREPQPTH